MLMSLKTNQLPNYQIDIKNAAYELKVYYDKVESTMTEGEKNEIKYQIK